jgi:hypothetical protein
MSLPESVLNVIDDWKFCWKASELAAEYLRRKSNTEFDLIVWYNLGRGPDFNLAFLGYFFGTWENAGTIIHQADCWSEYRVQVVEMLQYFGCHVAAQAFIEAISLAEAMNKHISESMEEYPDSILIKKRELDEMAAGDSDYAKLSKIIRAKNHEFFAND